MCVRGVFAGMEDEAALKARSARTVEMLVTALRADGGEAGADKVPGPFERCICFGLLDEFVETLQGIQDDLNAQYPEAAAVLQDGTQDVLDYYETCHKMLPVHADSCGDVLAIFDNIERERANLQGLREECAQLEENASKKKAEIEGLDARATTLAKNHEELDAKVKAFEASVTQRGDLERQCKDLNLKVQELSAQAASIEKKSTQLKANIEKREKEHKKMSDEYKDLERKVSDLNDRKKDLEDQTQNSEASLLKKSSVTEERFTLMSTDLEKAVNNLEEVMKVVPNPSTFQCD